MKKLVLVFLFVSVLPVSAQPINNPSTILFTASPDHTVTDLGVSIVTEYLMEFTEEAGTSPLQALALGKPTPNSANDITVDLAALRPKLTIKPASYTIRIVAKGPGGESRTAASVPFSLTVRAPTAPVGAPRVVSSATSPTSPAKAEVLLLNGRSWMDAGVLHIGTW